MKTLHYVSVVFCLAISMINAMEIIDTNAITTTNTIGVLGGQVLTPRGSLAIEECPICYDTIHKDPLTEDKKAVSLVCCGQFFHEGCLNNWKKSTLESNTAWTCPTCRSSDQDLIIKNAVYCALCKKPCRNDDVVIPIACKVPITVTKKMNDWQQGEGSLLSILVSMPQAFLMQNETVIDYFHGECLKSYYSTQTRGYDKINDEIVYYCPIHTKNKITLPQSKILLDIDLPPKENMTEDDVAALAKELEQQELDHFKLTLIIRNVGGIGPHESI